MAATFTNCKEKFDAARSSAFPPSTNAMVVSFSWSSVKLFLVIGMGWNSGSFICT